MYHSFRPGKVWLDTEGKRIQAHGGSVLFHDGVFYWYGENKAGITGYATGEKCPDWHHGVSLYSSHDLYNWENRGVIMVDNENPDSPFYPTKLMDRPHILYNEKTGLFVLWAKCAGNDFSTSGLGVCVSEDITGPFRFLHFIIPHPYHAGDFDLVAEGGRAYILYENPHDSMICQTLTDDYTDLTDEVTAHIPMPQPPYTREAPAYFRRGSRQFLLTSGTTGYFPNPSEVYEMHGFHGEWGGLGDPCRGDVEHTSFRSQFSSVFRHPTVPDLYIALGDRWLTDLPVPMPDFCDLFRRMFDPQQRDPLPPDFDFHVYSANDTSEADYVWLPIRFTPEGTPFIVWRDEWTVENFNED